MAEDDRDKTKRHDGEIPASPLPRAPASPRHPVTVPLYGVMAEFDNPSELVAAARRTYEAGYRRINGYSPPIEKCEAIVFTPRLPIIV